MTVRDIALSAAAILQADDIAEALKQYDADSDTELDSDAKTLIKCVNLAKNEIADDFPIVVTTVVEAEGGVIPLSALDDVSCVKRVTDIRGETVAFSLGSKGVTVAHGGRYSVEYTRINSDAEIDDDVVFGIGIDADTAAYLAARDYCLISGRTDEAAVWDQLYNTAAENKRIRRRAFLPRRKFL